MIEQRDRIVTQLKVEGVPQYAADIGKGASSLDNFAGSESHAGQQASALSSSLQALTAIGATAFFTKLAAESARAAMAIEITEKQFGRLLGSSRAAGEQVEWLHRMARDIHGQSFQSIEAATRMMVDFGLATEQDTKMVNLLGDAALARGQDLQSMVLFAERMKEGMYMARMGIPFGITPSALKAQGIHFEGRNVIEEDQSKLLAATLAIWSAKYAGINKEVAKTAADAAEDMGQAADELKAKLGEGLLPILTTIDRGIEGLADAFRHTDPAFLKFVSTSLLAGTALAGIIAAQKTWLMLKNLSTIAENTSTIAKGKNIVATTGEIGATEKQTLAQWQQDKARLQAIGVSEKYIAQTEAEILARNQNTAAIEREAVSINKANIATERLIISQKQQMMLPLGSDPNFSIYKTGAQLALPMQYETNVSTRWFGDFAKQGKILSEAERNAIAISAIASANEKIGVSSAGILIGLRGTLAGLGKMALWMAALTAITDTISAIAEKAPEVEYFKPPKNPPSFGQAYGRSLLGPGEYIRTMKEMPANLEQAKMWFYLGARPYDNKGSFLPGLPPPLRAQEFSGKVEGELQRLQNIGASEKEIAKAQQEAIAARKTEIILWDDSIKRAQAMQGSQKAINALTEERKKAQESLNSLQQDQSQKDFTTLLKPAEAASRTTAALESQLKVMETMKAPAEEMLGKRREEMKAAEEQLKIYDNLLNNQKEFALTADQIKQVEDARLATNEKIASIYAAIQSVPIELSKRAAEEFSRSAAERQAAEYIAAAGQRPWSNIAAFEGQQMGQKQADLAAARERIAAIDKDIEANKNNLFFQDQAKSLLDERLNLTKEIADLEKEIALLPEQRFQREIAGSESLIAYYKAQLQRAAVTNAPMGERQLWQMGIEGEAEVLRRKYQREADIAKEAGNMGAYWTAQGKIAGVGADSLDAQRYMKQVEEDRIKSSLGITQSTRELAASLGASSTSLLAFDQGLIEANKSLAKIYFGKYREAAAGSPEQAQYLAQAMGFVGQAQKIWEQTDLFTEAGQRAGLKMADMFNQRLQDGAQAYAARLTSELQQVALNLPSGVSRLLPSSTELNRMLPETRRYTPALYGIPGLWPGAEKDLPGAFPYPAKPAASNTVLQINITGDSKDAIMSAVSKFLDEQFAFESSSYSGVQ